MTNLVYDPELDVLFLLQRAPNCNLISYDGMIWRVVLKQEFLDLVERAEDLGAL